MRRMYFPVLPEASQDEVSFYILSSQTLARARGLLFSPAYLSAPVCWVYHPYNLTLCQHWHNRDDMQRGQLQIRCETWYEIRPCSVKFRGSFARDWDFTSRVQRVGHCEVDHTCHSSEALCFQILQGPRTPCSVLFYGFHWIHCCFPAFTLVALWLDGERIGIKWKRPEIEPYRKVVPQSFSNQR